MRFVADFPLPDEDARLRMWRTDATKGEFRKLARDLPAHHVAGWLPG